MWRSPAKLAVVLGEQLGNNFSRSASGLRRSASRPQAPRREPTASRSAGGARRASAVVASRLNSMIRSDTKVVASAGEHFVCSVLSQLGWAAALTREGVARADILAVHADELRQMIEVQVKTISPSRKPGWPMGGK